MSLPLAILRHNLGARILKTGLAVFAALLVCQALAPDYAVYAGVAAFLAVQPSVVRSRLNAHQQLLGNAIGALLGVGVAFTLGHGPLAMSAGVVLLLVVLRRLHLPDSVNLAVVMLLFVLGRPEGDSFRYGLFRIGAVFFGTAVGYLVNRFVAPPDYRAQVCRHLAAAGAEADQLLDDVCRHLGAPAALGKAAIKARAATVQREVDLARHYLQLADEDGSARGETLHKAINSVAVFAERLMDSHKALLLAGPIGAVGTAAVARGLGAVRAARHAVYGRLPAGAGRPGPRDPGALAQVQAALGVLQALVDERVAVPDGRAAGLTLHGVLTNLQHMAWRLESLERFLDAAEQGARAA